MLRRGQLYDNREDVFVGPVEILRRADWPRKTASVVDKVVVSNLVEEEWVILKAGAGRSAARQREIGARVAVRDNTEAACGDALQDIFLPAVGVQGRKFCEQ